MKTAGVKHVITIGLVFAFIVCSRVLAAAPSPIEKGPQTQEDLRRMRESLARAQERRLKETTRIERDIVYGTDDPQRQNLDLYVPKNADKPLPLVVWIHGGAWKAGDKRPTPAVRLLDNGFAVASIHYRFTTTAKFPAQIHDCKAAIRFLRASAGKYNIDPNHIGVWGAAAGGHLVALLGTTNGNKELEGTVGDYLTVSSDVQAVCDWFGPSDFFTMPIGSRQFKENEDPEMQLFGGRLSEKRELAEQAGPYQHAGTKTVPFLIMHGDKDNLVPLEQSRMLHEKLKAAGTDSTLIVMEGKGHGFGNGDDVYKPIEAFFERTLK
jgi:acetyl esterase/lipase